MRRLHRGAATIGIAIILAACSGGTASTSGPGGGPCSDSTAATTANATVEGNTWGPVSAKVNDVITWANADGVPHRVALDDGSCGMSGNIPAGGTASLVFTAAGTYPFHCGVHSSMKGSITIT